jgi:hypothetical protein
LANASPDTGTENWYLAATPSVLVCWGAALMATVNVTLLKFMDASGISG